MKTLIKITALAVIAVLAVFSCAQEPELTGINWEEINSKYDPGKNSDSQNAQSVLSYEFDIDGSLSTTVNALNELTITFPASSDFLKAAGKVDVAKLREFLSFHHFTKAPAPIAGKADELGTALEYIIVRQNVNVFTLKLTKTFVATDSSVVMKIDGTKYTFAGGNKLDLVGKGKSGEAGYDDFYVEIPVDGATGPSGFVEPGNKGWSLSLRSIDPDSADPATGILTDSTIAYLYLGYYIAGEDADITTIATAVAAQLKVGLKIQKLVSGTWSDVNGTITYDSETGRFIVESLTLQDLVPFRVMWEGSAPVTTSATYYGVKQYIKIIGVNTQGDWRPAYYQTGKVYGPVADVWTKDRGFVSPTHVMIYKKDFSDRNVVIDVLFNNGVGISDGGNTSWLKNLNKQTFKDNFKIAYYKNGNYWSTADEFTSRTDVVYIDIEDVVFFSHNPNNEEDLGLNAVRITLDPEYKLNINDQTMYFYISPEICYTDGKTALGNPNNVTHGFFQAYRATFASFPAPPPPPTPLTANVWANDNLSSADEKWYSFSVIEGYTYLVRWNDNYDGDGTKTGYVNVSAQYTGSGTWIFGNSYYGETSGWTTPRMITATQTGTVLIKVSSYDPGTYGIMYSAINATALTNGIWQDGNIVTSSGEQWFSFTAATTSDHYIHATFGTLTNLYVQVYNSNGNTVGYQTQLYDYNPYTSQYLTSGQKYYIRVWPSYSDGSGTYQIAINTSYNPPFDIWPPSSSTELNAGLWEAGSIATPGGEEWFSFTATATGYQYIHVTFGTLSDLYVQLYNSSGETVGSQTELYSSYRSTSQSVTSGQTYYIRVWPYSGYSGTYQIAFNTSYTRPEGTWTPSASYTELSAGIWEDGNIATSDGEEWFSFTATASYQYIHASFGTLTNLYVQLYNNYGETVGYQAELYDSYPYANRDVTSGQTYYIRVWPSSGSGTYRIAFKTSYYPPFDIWPPSNTSLTAGEWANGNIAIDGEEWFSFTATADTQYIHATFGTLSDFYVHLYDSSSETVEYQARLNDSNPYAQRNVTSGQIYYIRVWPYSGSGTYQITFNTAPWTLLPDATPLSDGEWEDGNLETSEDWYSISVSPGTYYVWWNDRDNTNGYVDIKVAAYYSNGTEIFDEDTGYGDDNSASFYSEVTGTVYVKVYPYSSGSEGSYGIAYSTTSSRPIEE